MSSGGGTSEQTPGSYQQTSNLDTIISSVPPKSSGFRHPNNSPSPTQEDSTGEEGSKKYRASPRSIDMKTDQSNFDWKTQNGGAGDNMTEDPRPATTDPSSGNRHRRSTSGGSPGVGPYGDLHPTQISFGSHGSMVIPPQMMNWPPAAPYSSDGPEGHYQRHRRAGSWSGQYPPASAPPSPRYFSQGNPMVPFLNDQQSRSEMNPLLGGPQTSSIGRSSSSRGKRKSGSGEHRRSFSSGAANPGMHEDFFKPPEGMPPPPPPRQPEQFSPRTEFMKLAGGFQRSPSSPSGRKMSPMPYAPQSPHGTPRASSMRGFSSSNMENTVSFSPHVSVSPHPQSAYGSIDMNNAPTSTQLPDFPSSTGGEAVFLTQKSGQRHRESTRKRHMRQQSAQLFMEDVKGTQQPLACRDIVFLLLFLFHIVGVAFLATTYGHVALDQKSQIEIGEGNVELYYFNLVYVAGMSGFFAVAASLMALGLMTIIARRFVQVALVLAVTISFAWGTIGIGLSPKNIVPITGFIALALSVAYTFIVWDRIPFCAANLVTALSGIKANSGTLVIAICFQIFCFAYCIFYALVVVGVHDAILEDKLHLSSDMQGFVYAMLGISFYWTYHVILNIVQVTTSGVVADWWYGPGNVDVMRSFSRTVFYSLGSICFGSLLVGPVRLLRQIAIIFRPSADDDSALMCLHECLNAIQTCITSCVDGLYNHFNPWAFTYIGVYRYGFLDAGAHAMELFRTRGWTRIVTDDLVPNILLMTSIVIGGATGCFAHLIEHIDALHITSLGQPGAVSFGVGIVIGWVVTSVLFGIISSSVNAVLVCFAASPVDFENNHPELSHEMRAAWREVWPGCMDVIDLRVALAGGQSPHHSQRISESFSAGPSGGIPAEFL